MFPTAGPELVEGVKKFSVLSSVLGIEIEKV